MNIVFFSHPSFLGHQSMIRFSKMLANGMKERGHQVTIWEPKPFFYNIAFLKPVQKWLGYIDQYILFPAAVRTKLKDYSTDTIFVFTDQALGPWVPLVANRTHVIHCHDFLAQQSALGEIKENATGWTGKQYQSYIRKGYKKGKVFISVSQKTKHDLHQFLTAAPVLSEVVYNGLNQEFKPGDVKIGREKLSEKFNTDLSDGFILHIGGNQWYKNRAGVIEIYSRWRANNNLNYPLLLIGEKPDNDLLQKQLQSAFKNDIYFLSGIDDQTVRLAYESASVFLFPSLDEGFGWPIAEAMASGCPVITTDKAPMTEVAGDAACFIPRRPSDSKLAEKWAEDAAHIVQKIVSLSDEERARLVATGLEQAKKFDTNLAINQIESIYLKAKLN